MADVFKTPGVYIKEIPLFPPSIAEVETAIPAFIGYTEKASINGLNLLLKPTRVSSLLEYASMFGAAQNENAISVTITDATDSNGAATRTIAVDSKEQFEAQLSRFKMYYSLQMFFANGGGPCYIVSVGVYGDQPGTGTYADADVKQSDLAAGLAEIAKFDEPTLLVFPDATALSDSDFNITMTAALQQCQELQDRFAIMDVKPVKVAGKVTIDASMNGFRNTQLMENSIDRLKYGAAYFPFLETAIKYLYQDSNIIINYQAAGSPLPPVIKSSLDVIKDTAPVATPPPADAAVAGNTELYNLVKAELNKLTVSLPPSGAVAGIYASVDSDRGVWKAPANVSMAYVNAASVKISNSDQMNLNVDPTSGKSINAIRYFTGKGVLIWGARTLAGNDNEWRYISVRRFFNYAEESIKKGSEWVVFEPNDANTWIRVKAMIENFLTKQWRAGALAGAKPEQAFFVNVGLGLTMTSLDILEGRMNIEIGMAVVRPAEFIILKFSHKLQES